MLAWLRAAFCGAVLIRFFCVTELTVQRVVVTVPAVLVAMGFSALVLSREERRLAEPGWSWLSVSLDSVSCFFALLPVALWPEPVYVHVPLLNKVDTIVLLVVVLVSSFRLSAAVAWFSGALNTASFVVLMALDRARPWSDAERGASVLFVFLLIGTKAIAVLAAANTRRLVRRGALDASDAERARLCLDVLLREHHDLRSRVSSAMLHADMAARELAARELRGSALEDHTAALSRELRAVSQMTRQIKEQSQAELLLREAAAPCDVRSVVEHVSADLEQRFPAVRVSLHISPSSARITCPGGDAGAARLVQNLLVNAVEGDGQRGARNIHVHVQRRAAAVQLVVRDDGPGFHDEVLLAAGSRTCTTKGEGWGLGLSFVRRSVEQSSGCLLLRNLPTGGAAVEVTWPAQSREDSGELPPPVALSA